MVIINGIIHPVDAPVIPNGFVAWEGGRITAVGPMSGLPQGLGETLDVRGAHVTPGYIDAHCHIGVFGDSLGFEGEDGNECTDPITPHLRALDALNPQDRCFEEARQGGVTTVVTGPGSANPVGGQMVCMKTAGEVVDRMVLEAPLAMKMATGENPKRVYHGRKESPTTRMTTAALIRGTLRRAEDYQDRLNQGEKVSFDQKLEALLPVLRGELPVHIHAHQANDIATVIRLAREFRLKCVIVHGTEGHLLADAIAESGLPVITGPILTDRSKPELRNKSLETPAALRAKGVKVAICTDHPVIPIQYLPLCAALAVRGGMDPEEALAAITLWPAQIIGQEERLGSLTPGKDADIVVTPGHPFSSMDAPSVVILNGERVV